MIRDKIVLSTSGKLQELLLREEKLELDKCLQTCRAFEQSNRHVQEIRQDKVHDSVNKVDNAKPRSQAGASGTGLVRPKRKCGFCGLFHERSKEKCPAWGKKCNNCGVKNHFKSCCKKVQTVDQNNKPEEATEEKFWLNYIDSSIHSKAKAKMIVNDCDLTFHIDTGAQVNTIQQRFVRKSQRIQKVSHLRMWNKSTAKSLGEATLTVTNLVNNETYDVTFVIVPNELDCLLGMKAVQELKLVTINTDNFIGSVKRHLGDLGEVKLRLTDDAKPRALPTRNIPLAERTEVKEQIDLLTERGILIPVTEPTEWVSQMAITKKSNGSWRICLDPQPLNKVLVRERYRLPTFNDVVPGLHNAKVFTKLDVQEAYWHIRLDEKSRLLTTMITPFGRYRWARLPFGLNVSSEIFQRKLNEALSDLEGTFTIADDIIIVGCGDNEIVAQKDNDEKLAKLYKRCEDRHIVLNEGKKDMGPEITFHGHRITPQGIKPDNDKIKAVLEMNAPADVTEIKRFCGLVQYMAKFVPNLSETFEPLRNLTRKNTPWKWTKQCTEAFERVKQLLKQTDVLAIYDPNKDLVLQVDSSKDGLGAALLQDGHPLEFASRSLKPAERNWAQIEKEALAVLYGLERFDQYTYGRPVIVENDHKPLETILKKPLSQAPKRLQDILMKMFRYNVTFQYVKGSELFIADTLSRAYSLSDDTELTRLKVCEVEIFDKIPDARITEIRRETAKDTTYQLLIDRIIEGWPQNKNDLKPEVRPYFSIRDTLSFYDGIILKGEAVLIPKAWRGQIKERLHSAHLGFDSMVRRARGTVFWLGMNQEIRQLADNCERCMERKPKLQKEPLRQHDDGNYPWEKIGLDLFEIQDVDLLTATSSSQVIIKLKKQFAQFGIPRIIISDGGPQFTSDEFSQFTKRWGIQHHVTSPYHPISNGKAEAGVKIIKGMMVKCLNSRTDQYEALLELRNTPRQDTGLSPAQMMFGRETRSMLPLVQEKSPRNQKRDARKDCIKKSYDCSARIKLKFENSQPVYFRHKPDKPWRKGVVTESTDRNCIVTSTDGVQYKRNSEHIRPTSIPVQIRDKSPERTTVQEQPADTHVKEPDQRRSIPESTCLESATTPVTRPRREVKTPTYLKDYVRF
ncbi:hypothetical protein ACJMK2_004316 [Sinanodonta woodiana]|uniref:Endonuclease n=1 Tax=Sinanodonta woodiana TaxID=1069815 RepID=A0ABD3Y0T5_SINWO